mmetsp:Transcript_26958/g.80341  ORF Transcript_26958/g.80341 Transcript_26958/m.80341 type:complete len:270 (+) Transcript_26958:153-962(+)
MESDSLQVRTYVNGTLYSILVRSSLKEHAAEIGLPDSLRALIEHSDDTLARQINYILEQLESPPADDGAASDDEDDDAEEDAEDEGDVDDDEVDLFAESPLDLSAADGAAGEELLCSHYIAGFADAQREAARLDDNDPHQAEAARRAAAAQAATARGMPVRRYHSSDEPLQRPATPGSVRPPPPAGASQPSSRPPSRPPPPSQPLPPPEPPVVRPGSSAPADEVFALRSKVPRTPQVKTRAELQPLQPALTKSARDRVRAKAPSEAAPL